MADPREQGVHPLQRAFNEWERTEYPKLQAFRQKLYESSTMLREGILSERDFLEGLIDQDYSEAVNFTVRWEPAFPESEMDFTLEKTSDRKLKVSRDQKDYSAFSVPKFTATIGLSEEGMMQLEHVEASHFDWEEGKLEVYEDDGFLLSDVITIASASITTKAEQGAMLKEALSRVSPF